MSAKAFLRCVCAASLSLLGSAALANETVRYIYDARGRLIRVDRTGAINNGVTATYEYDRANNRRRARTTGSANLPPP